MVSPKHSQEIAAALAATLTLRLAHLPLVSGSLVAAGVGTGIGWLVVRAFRSRLIQARAWVTGSSFCVYEIPTKVDISLSDGTVKPAGEVGYIGQTKRSAKERLIEASHPVNRSWGRLYLSVAGAKITPCVSEEGTLVLERQLITAAAQSGIRLFNIEHNPIANRIPQQVGASRVAA